MTHHEVEKYRKSIRVLHWIHSGAFVLLFLTGLIFSIPGLGFLAEDSLSRIIHRIGAAIFVITPIIYLVINPKSAGRGLREAFTWNIKEDIGWLKAIPSYYFRGDERNMPPQGIINTGQRLWWLLVIVLGVLFAITGAVMSSARTSAPPGLLQWMISVHDVCFIAIGCMFFVHLYNAVLHPFFDEAWSAMTSGKISIEYAKKHHGKWYAEISKNNKEPQ